MNKILISVLIILFSSCSREKQYDFRIRNNTNFKLNVVKFDWCQSENAVSIDPMDSIETTLYYKLKILNFVSPGSLCVIVSEYSDSSSNYQNNQGGGTGRDGLKKGLNVVDIYYDNEEFILEFK